MIIDSFLTYG